MSLVLILTIDLDRLSPMLTGFDPKTGLTPVRCTHSSTQRQQRKLLVHGFDLSAPPRLRVRQAFDPNQKN